jgi:copper chaperone CopZ
MPIFGGIMVEYIVPGMRCMFCCYRLKAALRKIDPNLKVEIDLQTGRVRVPKQQDAHILERAIAYLEDLTPVVGTSGSGSQSRRRSAS